MKELPRRILCCKSRGIIVISSFPLKRQFFSKCFNFVQLELKGIRLCKKKLCALNEKAVTCKNKYVKDRQKNPCHSNNLGTYKPLKTPRSDNEV